MWISVLLLALAFIAGAALWFNQRSALRRNERSVFAAYAGSESCRDCHATAYAEWRKSNHGLAERLLAPAMDDVAFQPRTFTHGSQHTDISPYRVTTLGPGRGSPRSPSSVSSATIRCGSFSCSLPGGGFRRWKRSDPHATSGSMSTATKTGSPASGGIGPGAA